MRSASCAVRSCRLGALLLLAYAVLVVPVGVDGGSAPGIRPSLAPTLTATIPAANAVRVDPAAAIEVHFSEAMNVSTVTYTIQPSVAITPSWSPSNDTLRLQPSPPLAECTVYRVRVDGKDFDEALRLTGGTVPNPWSFMSACSRPFLLATTPTDGAVNVPPDTAITMRFSEPMNCQTMQIFLSPQLPGTLVLECDASGMNVTGRFAGGAKLAPGIRYSATAVGKDRDGNDLTPSLVPNPWSFDTNAPPSLTAPTFSASQCVDPGTALLISWTMTDDWDPPTNLTVRLSYFNGTGWETFLGPATGLPASASYRWTLPAIEVTTNVRLEVRDSAGAQNESTSAPFRIDGDPPRVLLTNPRDGGRDVPIEAAISLVFSEPMNPASVQAAISEDPPFPRRVFTWTAGDDAVTISFFPDTLRDRSTYNVTVAPTAADGCGHLLGQAYTFSFTTGKARPSAPARLVVAAIGETHVSLAWEPVTTYRTGTAIPATADISYRVLRSTNATRPGVLVLNTNRTGARDDGLKPSTVYWYTVVAVVDGVESEPSAPLRVQTSDPFFVTSAGRLSLLATFGVIGVALVIWGQARRVRRRAKSQALLAEEIRDIVARVRTVRAEPDPERRRALEGQLQARFRALVEGGEEPGEGFRPNPRLEGLYRALAQALLHSPEVDIAHGRTVVDARLGPLARGLRRYGAAYRLLSEAEASVASEMFPGLPESGRKALLLVYFYALEEYLGHRLRGLVPAGSTLLLGERGHLNVRRRGWEAQWAALSLGTLVYLADRNRHFFILDDDRWQREVEPLLRQAVEARNRTAHPSREAPPLEKVRELVYEAVPAIEAVLRKPRTPQPAS